ncbi:hypothetical protein BKA66DRAFT_570511 [Pyrenochaeta sp. MPI-SDFR-AT-0127]|nr:hypothetical protein BKA66DRAFT_570511 [Pyrenochaeta sp. MPI-SDFR-AT-0127]
MSIIDEGFAIRRNGTCLAGLEVDCGATRAPFRGCCPTGYACPSQYNIACCTPGRNCTEPLLAAPQPKCANATWDLFDNGGFFCCEHSLPGYNRSNTNGCAAPGARLAAGDQILSTVRVGVEATTSASLSASSTALASSTSNAGPASVSASLIPSHSSVPSDSGSSTPVGAIAGGVVGGVALIALLALLTWFFLRRKKQKAEENPYLLNQRHEVDATPTKYRMDGTSGVYEVDGASTPSGYATELHSQQKPVELPAEHR